MSKESAIEAAVIHARTRRRTSGTQWLDGSVDFDIYYATQYGLDVLKKDRSI